MNAKKHVVLKLQLGLDYENHKIHLILYQKTKFFLYFVNLKKEFSNHEEELLMNAHKQVVFKL